MGLLHPRRDIPRSRTELKNQRFSAVVIMNDDSKHPDGKKRSRVQLRVPQWHQNVPDDKLPYAMPLQGGQAQAGAGVGNVRIPPVGAKVFAHYDEEDPHLIYYSTSPTTDDVHKDNELLQEDYPHTYGEVDHAGNKEAINTKQNTRTYTHVTGATMHVDAKGGWNFYSPTSITLGSKGGVTIATEGGLNLHASGGTSIKGSSIDLNGSDATKTPTQIGARTAPSIASPAGKTTA